MIGLKPTNLVMSQDEGLAIVLMSTYISLKEIIVGLLHL